MPDTRVRIEVGFDGGQAMSLLVAEKDADELDKRLANGAEQTMSLEAEDGRYTIALRRVAFVKRFAREARVGFSSA